MYNTRYCTAHHHHHHHREIYYPKRANIIFLKVFYLFFFYLEWKNKREKIILFLTSKNKTTNFLFFLISYAPQLFTTCKHWDLWMNLNLTLSMVFYLQFNCNLHQTLVAMDSDMCPGLGFRNYNIKRTQYMLQMTTTEITHVHTAFNGIPFFILFFIWFDFILNCWFQ